MIRFEDSSTGRDVWVSAAAVIVVEDYRYSRIRKDRAQSEEVTATRLVLVNGGVVKVIGDATTVLTALGYGSLFWSESIVATDPTAKFRVQRNGQDTSWEAALAQTPERRAELMRVIYAKLSEAPATDEELVELVQRTLPTQAPSGIRSRRNELVLTGWVTKARTRSGGIRKRRGEHGLPMIVWQAVPPGGDVVVPSPKPKPSFYDDHALRAALTTALVESMRDPDGCGSDLEQVGDELEDDTWLFVSGALDVHHLVSDVLITLDKELTRVEYPDLSKLSEVYSTAVLVKAEKLLQHNAVRRDVFHASVFYVRGSEGNEYRLQVMEPFDEDATLDIGEVLPFVSCTCPNGMATGGRSRCYHSAAVVGLLMNESDDE